MTRRRWTTDATTELADDDEQTPLVDDVSGDTLELTDDEDREIGLGLQLMDDDDEVNLADDNSTTLLTDDTWTPDTVET